MDFTPSSGEELQAEYLVPRPNAVDALNAVAKMREEIAPLLHICEVRAIAADELWMSPCYRQDCLAIHFTWKKEPDRVMALFPRIEAELAPFGARPHWGKLFSMTSEQIRAGYPRWDDSLALRERLDPAGKFLSPFLGRVLGA
jgi:xylitol oxidase